MWNERLEEALVEEADGEECVVQLAGGKLLLHDKPSVNNE